MLGSQQLVHRAAEGVAIQPIDDIVDAVHIPLHHAAQNIRTGHLVAGHLYPLNGRQLAADQLLQRLLHLRIAVIAQLGGKAHHRGFADGGRLAQSGGGHKRRPVIVVQYERGDALLPLGKAVHAALNGLQDIFVHVSRFL